MRLVLVEQGFEPGRLVAHNGSRWRGGAICRARSPSTDSRRIRTCSPACARASPSRVSECARSAASSVARNCLSTGSGNLAVHHHGRMGVGHAQRVGRAGASHTEDEERRYGVPLRQLSRRAPGASCGARPSIAETRPVLTSRPSWRRDQYRRARPRAGLVIPEPRGDLKRFLSKRPTSTLMSS